MSLMSFLRRMICKPTWHANDDVSCGSAERMKYEKRDKEISQESHALGNAVTQMQGTAKDIRRSADALTRLARGL